MFFLRFLNEELTIKRPQASSIKNFLIEIGKLVVVRAVRIERYYRLFRPNFSMTNVIKEPHFNKLLDLIWGTIKAV